MNTLNVAPVAELTSNTPLSSFNAEPQRAQGAQREYAHADMSNDK